MLGSARAEALSYSAVKLFLKYSNLCENLKKKHTSTSRTDRRHTVASPRSAKSRAKKNRRRRRDVETAGELVCVCLSPRNLIDTPSWATAYAVQLRSWPLIKAFWTTLRPLADVRNYVIDWLPTTLARCTMVVSHNCTGTLTPEGEPKK